MFMISHWIFLRIRNVSDKTCRENQNTQFMSKTFFFGGGGLCHLFDNVEKYGTASPVNNIIQQMLSACWIT